MTATKSTIAAGHYAIVWPGNGKVYFYRVTIGKSGGAWAGMRFLTRQSSDDFIRLSKDGQAAAWPLILADPTAALRLYGQEIGRCGHCHKTLTDDASRAYGIGPKCRKVLGL